MNKEFDDIENQALEVYVIVRNLGRRIAELEEENYFLRRQLDKNKT